MILFKKSYLKYVWKAVIVLVGLSLLIGQVMFYLL